MTRTKEMAAAPRDGTRICVWRIVEDESSADWVVNVFWENGEWRAPDRRKDRPGTFRVDGARNWQTIKDYMAPHSPSYWSLIRVFLGSLYFKFRGDYERAAKESV